MFIECLNDGDKSDNGCTDKEKQPLIKEHYKKEFLTIKNTHKHTHMQIYYIYILYARTITQTNKHIRYALIQSTTNTQLTTIYKTIMWMSEQVTGVRLLAKKYGGK